MAKSNLYLLQFNNYFNKQLKVKNNIDDYASYQIYDTIEERNFVPGDGITTSIVLNYDGPNPNYLIEEDCITKTLRRWFVIKASRNVRGQFSAELRRDVLADKFEQYKLSPAIIHKGTLSEDSPLIFNDELIKVNQILKSQTKLTDETKVPWIVAYIPRHGQEILDSDGNQINWEGKQVEANAGITGYNYEYSTMEDALVALESEKYCILSNLDINIGSNSYDYFTYQFKYNPETDSIVITTVSKRNDGAFITSAINEAVGRAATTGALQDESIKALSKFYEFKNEYEGKIAKIGNEYYKLKINEGIASTINRYFQQGTQCWINCRNKMLEESGNVQYLGDTNTIIKGKISYFNASVEFEHYTNATATYDISTTRTPMEDAPYDMICMPYILDGEKASITIDAVDFDYNENVELNVATNLPTTWGSSVVYDVQILPYCPIRDLIDASGKINVASATDLGYRYDLIKDSDDNSLGIVFYCNTCSGTFDIPYSIANTGNIKVKHLTEIYRLVSPNFNGAYEFSPYMNGGVDYFNVDYTYLPYQPWIKLNPNYKYLYGKDFNDSRGLVLGGNFSITLMSNAWANYQMNNANFEAIFSRQIKNMRKNYRYDMTQGILEGLISGAGQSVAAGIATANPVVGTALGIANVGGMIGDVAFSQLRYKEKESYAKDMFTYGNQNIQAMPETISKITAFNFNSKYVPFLEMYECTEEEKTIVENKIKWTGMTVDVISNLDSFIKDEESFVQGEFIRMEDLDDDYNIASAINEEFRRGIYVKRSDV